MVLLFAMLGATAVALGLALGNRIPHIVATALFLVAAILTQV